MPTVHLLGPQRQRPTAPAVVRRIAGRVAVVTAGWQENEDDPLPGKLAARGVNLGIYRRAERVFDEDRELFQAHRERQLALKRLQQLYRLRLDHAIAAYVQLLELEGDRAEEPLAGELQAALEALRDLDRKHLERVREAHAEFEDRWQPSGRAAVARQRRELAAELETASAVVLAGGHVAVLLNRLRLFDLAPLLAGKTLVAWSAGAMVAARRIVLFHDSPPWGAGNAEVLDSGLDLCADVLPLPDARRRLRADDPLRVGRLARRFAPLSCVALDERSRLRRDESGWSGRRARLFGRDGAVRAVGESTWEALAP